MKSFISSSLFATTLALATFPAFAGSFQSLGMVQVPTEYSVTISKKSNPALSTKNLTHECSQLEKSVGLKAESCGVLESSALVEMALDQNND